MNDSQHQSEYNAEYSQDTGLQYDQPGNLDHRGGGPDVPEAFGVGSPDCLPLAYVGDVDARAQDVPRVAAERVNCR